MLLLRYLAPERRGRRPECKAAQQDVHKVPEQRRLTNLRLGESKKGRQGPKPLADMLGMACLAQPLMHLIQQLFVLVSIQYLQQA